jgi:hypothetical protein
LTLNLDHTGQILVEYLRGLLSAEPPEPNGQMPEAYADETARAHDEWARQCAAIRLLLGVRIVNDIIDTIEAS